MQCVQLQTVPGVEVHHKVPYVILSVNSARRAMILPVEGNAVSLCRLVPNLLCTFTFGLINPWARGGLKVVNCYKLLTNH